MSYSLPDSGGILLERSAAPQAFKREDLRVLIVADNASELYGGEAVLPLRYFEELCVRGVPTWLITHSRVRSELSTRLGKALDQVYFIPDSWLHRALWRLGRRLDYRLSYLTLSFVSRLVTQRAQCRLARKLIKRHRINVVHQPTPVSPREPSLLVKLGAPVVFGPMNGASDFIPAFRDEERPLTRWIVHALRGLAPTLNWLFNGKRRAAVLLVANERSRSVLVQAREAQIFSISENGVDMETWRSSKGGPRFDSVCRFAFVGRLVRSKGVHLWLEAFRQASDLQTPVTGIVIGDGLERRDLEDQARSHGILADRPNEPGKVYFAGWKEKSELVQLLGEQDCLVLPTTCESGGAVILEAMALELPVIASDWGGPADYIDRSCGILVPPHGKKAFVEGFARAMELVATDQELRLRMGRAGRLKVSELYSWDAKIENILDYYCIAAATRVHLKKDGSG